MMKVVMNLLTKVLKVVLKRVETKKPRKATKRRRSKSQKNQRRERSSFIIPSLRKTTSRERPLRSIKRLKR